MKQFLTVQDMAERYGVTRQCIYNWRVSGKIPSGFRIGHIRRWRLSDIEAFEAGRLNHE